MEPDVNDWVVQLIKQIPALIVLAWIVREFLRHSSSQLQVLSELTSAIKTMSDKINGSS